MIRNDYIMRLIELLGAFARRVYRRIESGELEELSGELDSASNQFLGVPLAVLSSSPLATLLGLFSSKEQLDYFRIMAAGVILEAKGRAAYREGDEIRAYQDWLKAISLLNAAAASNDPEIERITDEKMKQLETDLVEFDLPGHTCLDLAAFHERAGRLGRAEDHFFAAAESDEANARELFAFFERLSKKTDSELTLGNLTRSEISESLEECAKRWTRE